MKIFLIVMLTYQHSTPIHLLSTTLNFLFRHISGEILNVQTMQKKNIIIMIMRYAA